MLRPRLGAGRRQLRAGRRRHVPLLRQHGAAAATAPRSASAPASPSSTAATREDVIGAAARRAGLDRKDRRFPRKNTLARDPQHGGQPELDRAASSVGESYAAPRRAPGRPAPLCEARTRRYKRERQPASTTTTSWCGCATCCATHPRRADAPRRHATATSWSTSTRTPTALQARDRARLAADARQRHGGRRRRQSIYSFRGADFRNIMDFPSALPRHARDHARGELPLDASRSSTSPTRSSTAPREKHTKVLCARASRRQPPHAGARAGRARRSRASSASASSSCARRASPLVEIAVLFRSSFHSFDLELELQRRDIPFVKRGGFKFIETAHVKDVLAHLRVVGEPARRRLVAPRPAAARRPRPEDGGRHPRARRRARATSRRRPSVRPAYPRRGAYTKELGAPRRLLRELGDAGAPPRRAGGRGGRATTQPMLRQLHRDDFPKREKDLEHFVTHRGALPQPRRRSSPTWRSSRRPTASATCSPPTARTRDSSRSPPSTRRRASSGRRCS